MCRSHRALANSLFSLVQLRLNVCKYVQLVRLDLLDSHYRMLACQRGRLPSSTNRGEPTSIMTGALPAVGPIQKTHRRFDSSTLSNGARVRRFR